jgi:RNA polymerase sigma factor (TIGR02999 family)
MALALRPRIQGLPVRFISSSVTQWFWIASRRVSDFTRILEGVEQGDPKAAGELLPLVYQELRRLAAHKMTSESLGHTLQPTALVHEAWLRLIAGEQPPFENRAHFFGAAAEAMRRILIDHARRKHAVKHGGGLERIELDEINVPDQASQDTLLSVDEALDALAREDTKAAELVKLRFFGGLSVEEAATALGVTDRTARRYWRFARAWLHDHLGRQSN